MNPTQMSRKPPRPQGDPPQARHRSEEPGRDEQDAASATARNADGLEEIGARRQVIDTQGAPEADGGVREHGKTAGATKEPRKVSPGSR